MSTISGPEGEEPPPSNETYLRSVRAWMRTNHISFVALADMLHLSPGSVRNWFYQSNAPRITEKNKRAIDRIMARVEEEKNGQLNLAFVRVNRKDALIPLWCDAARVMDSNFSDLNSANARKFANWATATIMNAVTSAIADFEKSNDIMQTLGEIDAVLPRGGEADAFYFPVLWPAYRPLLVSLVAKNRNETAEEFISKVLTEAAKKRLMEEMRERRPIDITTQGLRVSGSPKERDDDEKGQPRKLTNAPTNEEVMAAIADLKRQISELSKRVLSPIGFGLRYNGTPDTADAHPQEQPSEQASMTQKTTTTPRGHKKGHKKS